MSLAAPRPPAVAPKALPHAFDDYVRLCERVRALCGVDLLQYKRPQMERRIRAWAERRGTPQLGTYARRLEADAGELAGLLDRVTINVSQLWRHPEQWEQLAGDVLPELARRGPIRAWSAGCSYGAEAYTLAAVCRDALPGACVEIRGTDLDARMIERARTGSFTAEDARTAPAEPLARHFPGGAASAEVRRMTSFEVGDLLRMPIPAGHFDLVLCRNTVIYFTEEVRDALHRRLAASLKPGGQLVVGTSERVVEPGALGLVASFPFMYRKA